MHRTLILLLGTTLATAACHSAGTPPASTAAPVAASEGTYALLDVEQRPQFRNTGELIREMDRRYPNSMRPERVVADVVVRLLVEADGTVTNPSIVRSSNLAFNEPSLEVLKVLRFHPGRVGGQPVRTWVDVPLQWRPPADR